MGRDDVAFEFDVALSYAGEDRRYVEDVATYLSEHGIRVFYDMDQAVAMWGEDLFEFLDAVYRLRSRYAVVFVSRYYVAKNWPTHERRSVQARALEDGEVYLLPVHLDDAILPGLRPTVHYMDGAKLTPHELGANILEKLGYDSRAVGSAYVPGIPYNPHEIQELLGHRPDYWEYMLYVGVVRQRMNAIEEKYRDHEMGFAPRNEKYVSRDEMIGYVSRTTNVIRDICASFMTIIRSDSLAKALGTAESASGDPELIVHMARRYVAVYEEFLDWSRDVRGTTFPVTFRESVAILAHLADQPIDELRRHASHFEDEIKKIPERLARGDAGRTTLVVTLDISDELADRFMGAFEKALEEYDE